MKKLISFVVSIVLPASIMVGGMANSAVAQDKAAKNSATRKVLLDNDKVQVFENTQRPGEVNASPPTTKFRVVRVLKGSTIERTHADGKKETFVRKTGEVFWNQPSPATYSNKNVGKTDYQTYVVVLK
jgi:hypothetical protein